MNVYKIDVTTYEKKKTQDKRNKRIRIPTHKLPTETIIGREGDEHRNRKIMKGI